MLHTFCMGKGEHDDWHRLQRRTLSHQHRAREPALLLAHSRVSLFLKAFALIFGIRKTVAYRPAPPSHYIECRTQLLHRMRSGRQFVLYLHIRVI